MENIEKLIVSEDIVQRDINWLSKGVNNGLNDYSSIIKFLLIQNQNVVNKLHHALDNNLVSFGNYLLSKERNDNLINKTNSDCVTHADLENWKSQK